MRSIYKLLLLSVVVCWLAACTGGLPWMSSPTATLPPGTPTRSIAHAMGKTQVPMQPKRVIVLDTAPLDAAIALGVKPVGSTLPERFPSYLGDRTQGIEVIGKTNEPNLEAVAQLQPDLILGNKIGLDRLYRRLAEIAPTVMAEGSGRSGEWKDNVRFYASVLDRSAAADKLLQDYQQRADTLKQQIQQQFSKSPVVSVVATGTGQIGAYTTRSFSGAVLQDLGLARPPAQASGQRWAIQVSREDLTSLDGDAIFLIESSFTPNSLTLDQFKSDPLFSRLNAVKQGRVYAVNAEVWTAGRSILAANQILQEVSQSLLARKPGT
ncbi:ABC transporter substrate-binding protein [Phormidesmis sp. 146-12]